MNSSHLQKLLLITIMVVLGGAFCYAQEEICDDGIDNDGDGFIDLNDGDCLCKTAIPSGLIPNPSFEDYIQCPTSDNDLDGYAVDWIQASAATSDFVHTCMGFLGNSFANNAEAPLPFPDGEGAIGFRDGNTGRPQFKEYVGAVLKEPLTAGVTYKLDFYVGFHDHFSSREFPMAVFFSPSAANLPFGGNDTSFGCPTNGPGWVEVGDTLIRGQNEWVRVEFTFTPDEAYEAIVLGPGCAQHPLWADEPYFWADRLALAALSDFSIPTSITGDICDDELLIELLPDQEGYQWYFEGVAIVGETGQVLSLNSNSPEGTYVAVIYTEDGCFLSEEFFLTFPPGEYPLEVEICDGEAFELGSQLLDTEGMYEELFPLGTVCDSLVQLNLIVNPHTEGVYVETFCTGETITYEGEEYTIGGDYEIIIPNKKGCDSTIKISLIEVDTTVEYYTDPEEICEGDTLIFGSMILTEEGVFSERISLDTGCDSTSVIEVFVNRDSEAFVIDTICPGQSIEIGAVTYNTPGQYSNVIPNDNGCDSVMTIEIIEVPDVQLLDVIDTIQMNLGEYIDLIPTMSSDVARVEWYQNGNLIGEDLQLTELSPYDDATYQVFAYTEHGCLTTRTITIEVDREIRIYIPNVISNLEYNPNDRFIIGSNIAVKDINDLRVYDRWGELIFTYKGRLDAYEGWDGRFKNGYVEQGVYTYMIEFGLVDGTPLFMAGSLTFLD